jgi:hypothetical protein
LRRRTQAPPTTPAYLRVATGEQVAIGVPAVRPGTAATIIAEGGLNEIAIDMVACRLRDLIGDAPDCE